MALLASSRLQPLRAGSRDIRLYFFPQTLSISEVVQIILILIFRQLLFLIGLGNDIRPSTTNDGGQLVLPELRLCMPFRLSRDDLMRYANAVDLHDVDSIFSNPAQSCLLLSAFSEPAMLLLLASRGCPVRPLGSVNVRNRFEILEPELCTIDALLSMEIAELRARLVAKPRRVKRGLEIDLEVEIWNVDKEAIIFRQTFTMLQFMKIKAVPSSTAEEPAPRNDDSLWHEIKTSTFKIAADAPFTWAKICKDYNLLHISTLAAKLFGFRGRIAHGNHALALGIVQLHHEDEIDMISTDNSCRRVIMEVQFRRPMVIPATIGVSMQTSESEIDLRIMKGDKVCVTARVEVLLEN